MPTLADYPEKANVATYGVPDSGVVTVYPSDPYWQDPDPDVAPYVPAPSGRLPTIEDADGDTLVNWDVWIELIVYDDDTEDFLGTDDPFARPSWITEVLLQAIGGDGGTDGLGGLTLDRNQFHSNLKLYVIGVSIEDGINPATTGFFRLYDVGAAPPNVELVWTHETGAGIHELWYLAKFTGTPVKLWEAPSNNDVIGKGWAHTDGYVYFPFHDNGTGNEQVRRIKKDGSEASPSTIYSNPGGSLSPDILLTIWNDKIYFGLWGSSGLGYMNLDGTGAEFASGVGIPIGNSLWPTRDGNRMARQYGFYANHFDPDTDTELNLLNQGVTHAGLAPDYPSGEWYSIDTGGSNQLVRYDDATWANRTEIKDLEAAAGGDTYQLHSVFQRVAYFTGENGNDDVCLFGYDLDADTLVEAVNFDDAGYSVPYRDAWRVTLAAIGTGG